MPKSLPPEEVNRLLSLDTRPTLKPNPNSTYQKYLKDRYERKWDEESRARQRKYVKDYAARNKDLIRARYLKRKLRKIQEEQDNPEQKETQINK